ncbi:hypothetical protein PybrP1_006443 [[Pythium] brassicae (nom. inval.)]|nr:hypothetical protein PybrP1_006443 [[Pythium] brassicae (nom. inval.)]
MAPQGDALMRALWSSESDEGETMDDVLALFLGDLDALDAQALPNSATDSPAFAVMDPPTFAATDPPKPTRKRNRARTSNPANTTWRRQKDELAMLRDREEERLEHEIEAERNARLQNSKLRKLAKDTLQMTREMEAAFAKYPPPSAAALLEVCPERQLVPAQDAHIYRVLQRALDSRNLGVGPLPSRATGATHPEIDTSVLLNNSRVLPFSLQLINDVLWLDNGVAKMQTLESPFKVIHKADSLLFMEKHYSVRDAATNEVAVCVLHTVVKRRIDSNRTVTAWESMGDWPSEVASENGERARVSLREHGWATLESVAGSDGCSQLSTLNASTIVLPAFTPSEPARPAAWSHDSASPFLKAFWDSIVPSHDSAFRARMQTADESSRRAGATTKEAFSVLAQQVALVFALEPERPLKRARRVRAKEKINTLRDTIESLECHLAALKSNRQQARESAMTTIAMLTDSGKGGAEALETNRKLRKLVNTQLQFAGKVGEKLLAHTNTELQLTLTTERFEKQAPLTDADFAVFYEALTGKLDAIYSQWDKVLVERNLASAEVSFQDAHVEISEDNIATLYFRDEKLLPFDFQSVNDACWRHAKMGSITAEDQGGILLPRDDDVVLVKKAFSLPLANNEHAAIPIRSVFKRFVSETRVVLCWEGTAEWPGELVSDSEATRSPMRENGWGLIRPMPGNPELCHVQVCVRMKPGLSDERILDIPAQVGQLTRMMIPAYQRMISTRFQMVENLLIDKFFGGGDNGF